MKKYKRNICTVESERHNKGLFLENIQVYINKEALKKENNK
jgi:hypothetical protein